MSATGDAAVDYVRRGLAIIPLAPHKKKPSVDEGLKSATTHAGDVREWYEANPNDNVAIVTGKVSGNIGVIDIDYDDDEGKDGYEYLRAWEKLHGELPETWTATTARGGQHLYYRFIGEVPRNSSNEEFAIDFRGNGGYVMAPPSIHPNGRTVEWDFDPEDYDLAYADDNVLAFLESIRDTKSLSVSGNRFNLPETIKRGERDNVLFKYACSLQSQGMSDAEITVLVHDANERRCEVPLSRAAVDAKIRQALKYEKGKAIDLAKVEETQKTVSLARKSNGRICQTIDNCMEVLDGDAAISGRFFYNTLSYTRMVQLPLPWRGGDGISPIRDSDYCELSAYMERNYSLERKGNVIDAVMAVSERNKRNPLTEWLDSLVWDGTERISTMLSKYLGCELSDYNIAVMHMTMQGAVKRAYEPGCKFDYMPVLVGAQGQGKSFFVSRLATRQEWYLDGLSTFDGDAAVEKLRGAWFAEIAELAAFKRAKEVEAIKSFVTIRNDTIRPKYGRETEQRPRTCVFIGTTNDFGFLTDKTGNRRFLPIKCMETEPYGDMFSEEAEREFQQAWAQAVHIYKTKRPTLRLAPEIEAQAAIIQQQHMEDDPRVSIIQAYLDGIRMMPRNNKRVCVAEICEKALDMEKKDYFGKPAITNEIHRIMQNEVSGWIRCQGKKKCGEWGVQRCYEPEGYAEIMQELL